MRDVKDRKRLWIDFMDLKSPVNRLAVIDCQEGMPIRPSLWWENQRERVDWAYTTYQRQMDNLGKIDDHMVPYLRMDTGTETFAEAFGCKVYRPLDSNPFALPLVNNAADAARINIPNLQDTNLMRLFEMGQVLRERAGNDALVGLPDIQTPGDIAALIWDKVDFFATMLEEPKAVTELIQKIRAFMFDFLDLWFKTFGRETIAHFPDYYLPYGITMSEDEIGSVSKAMFNVFFAEDLKLFSERYGQIGIHCCANSKHQWDNLKKVPNLKLINLHRDAETTLESMEAFASVCAQMPAEVLADPDTLENAQRLHIANFLSFETVREAQVYMENFYIKHPHMRTNVR